MTLHRSIPALVLLAGASAWGQALPATAPTTPPLPAAPAAAPQQYLPAPPVPAANRAFVAFSPAGLLSVTANNSSLNQILRDISRATGMKITGGVNDERVFGSYGPADPSSVLTTLLNGTGSNMLIVLNGAHAPTELVLTPRNGGATPPSPNAGHERDEDDLPPRGMPHFSRGADPNDPRPQQPVRSQPPPPVPQPAMAAQPQPDSSVPPAPTPPAPNTTSDESPNGVKTPQQIYDQLMQMQQKQQQQQQQKTPPGTSTPGTKPPL